MTFHHSILVGVVTGFLISGFDHHALATNFTNGDFTTHVQVDWGDTPNTFPQTNAAWLLQENYDSVYASTSGTLEIGIPGTSGFSEVFTGAAELLDYLPDVGPIGPLNSDLVNPTTTSSGEFGGSVTALVLNIDFSDAGLLPGNVGIPFGDLVLQNFSGGQLTPLNGLTVRQFSAGMNGLLGGGIFFIFKHNFTYHTADIATLDPILANINDSFSQGAVSAFATNNLFVPPISLLIQSVSRTGNAVTFTWNTIANQRYQVQFTRSLNPTNWTSLGGIITATNTTMTASDTMTNAQMFYRIKLLP
jgi:hypothetical protein